jgi:hypothetical protein
VAGLTGRMLGAAKLDAATYEEVEADATATPQALLVVVLAAVAGGVSAIRATGIVGLVLAGLASLLGGTCGPSSRSSWGHGFFRAPRRMQTSASSSGPSGSLPHLA